MTKTILKDPVTGLFPNEEVFARACIKHNQSDAFRLAHSAEYCNRFTKEQINDKASKMAAKPAVVARVRQLLDEAKIQDLETVGHAFQELCSDLALARSLKNMTAVAAFQRIKLQVLGMLKETVLLNMEQTISDEELVKRVAGTNPALATALKASLGKEDRYAA